MYALSAQCLTQSLLCCLLVSIHFLLKTVVEAEVLELVRVLGAGHHAQVVTQAVLLQVPLAHLDVIACTDSDLALCTLNVQVLAKVLGLAVHLDALLEELLKVRSLHESILHRMGAVHNELDSFCLLLSLALGRATLRRSRELAHPCRRISPC